MTLEHKTRDLNHLKAELISLIYALDNICKSEDAQTLNIEKIIFKVIFSNAY